MQKAWLQAEQVGNTKAQYRKECNVFYLLKEQGGGGQCLQLRAIADEMEGSIGKSWPSVGHDVTGNPA